MGKKHHNLLKPRLQGFITARSNTLAERERTSPLSKTARRGIIHPPHTKHQYKTPLAARVDPIDRSFMPRPASVLWTHFRRDGAAKRAVCKYCAHNMCGLVSRMRSHLARKCPDCPAHVKEEMFEADMSRKMALAMAGTGAGASASGGAGPSSSSSASAASPHNVLSSLSSAPSAASGASAAQHGNRSGNANVLMLSASTGPPAKKQRRARLSPASITTAASMTTAASLADDKGDDIDSYVAKAILGAALPVGVVEAPAFARMLKRLAPPGYEPPSAFTLATSALDLEYTEAQLKLRAEVLDAQAVCLGVESWAATLQRPILSCVVNNTPTPGVFALESTGEVPHTPEVLVEKIESVMTQIGTGRVAVVVTDTTTSDSMKQAALALQAKYPAITFLPSCAHAMHAMVAELLALAPVAATLAVCHELARFLARHHVARAALARIAEQMQGLEPSSSSSVASSVASVLLSPLGALDGDLSMSAAAAAAAAAASSSSSMSPSSYYYSAPYTPASAYAPPSTASSTASASFSSASTNPVVALERLLSVHHHRHSLDILLAENHALSGLSALAKEKLLRLSFWEDVATLAALLEPFLELLRTFDADYPLLSTFYHRFTLLWSHVDKFTTSSGGPGSSGSGSGGAGNSGAASNGAGGGNAANGSAAGGNASNSTSANGAQVGDQLTGSASSATGALASRCQRVMSDYWQAIQHPAMYTAYMLDPRFPASSLSAEATSEVLAYLKRAADANSYANVVSELTRFTGRAGLFADDAVWESAQKCGPLNWWKGFIGGACPNLQAVALRTLCFPASSGLSRARRDMFDRIQTANARYMNDEQAAKAALVYLNTALAATASAVGEDDGGVSNETIV